MTRLLMKTADGVNKNIQAIANLFPNALTERKNEKGKTEYAIDFDVLRQELSSVIVEGAEERYQFTWPDKKKSIRLANASVSDTLRPYQEESIDFDTTENLYIEGDNLDVLKLLQETYLGKIKMIYIDPPYNTGNDFIYVDDFIMSTDEYGNVSGEYDDASNHMVKNLDSNGRFHTDWLNKIYPRLLVARDLLTDDGAIFISIDDNEVNNLSKMCNEIFGEEHFVAQLIWHSRQNKDNRNISGISIDHEYILCYAKQSRQRTFRGTERKVDQYKNPDNDPRGVWTSANMVGLATENARPNLHYDLINPYTGVNFGCPAKGWRYDKNTMNKLITENRILWPDSPDGRPRKKAFLSELDANLPGFPSIIGDGIYTNIGTKEITALFGGHCFDFPKPSSLLRQLITQVMGSDDIILDFFSGSATTAHAVMQLNAEDGGKRKFIMVQLPESCNENSEAAKAGYKNICEIGKERIRRAGAKICEKAQETKCQEHEKQIQHEENKTTEHQATSHCPPCDIGFRVLKLDSTNMKDVYYHPNEYTPSLFDHLVDNIKEDRSPEDLLFQVMLDLGVLLSSKIEETTIAGKKVFNVADNFLIACFDNNITEETVKAIAQKKPYYAVFRDSSYASDSVAANFEQIFAAYSPNTIRRVL